MNMKIINVGILDKVMINILKKIEQIKGFESDESK